MKHASIFSILMLTALVSGCGGGSDDMAGMAEEDAAAADYERGPHRGRILRDGDFALEVTIFETGVPPEYRLYAFQGGQPLPPGDVRATIELSRLDGEVNRFQFAPQGDVLVGDGVVTEPHSFDVVVVAEHAGKSHQWTFDSYEGRTAMPTAVAEAAGVRTETAGPATIHERIRLMGRVAMDANRFAEVRSRFAGPVREVRVGLGDEVKAGQTLAIVENRDSLRTFAVTAPLSGIVLARHTNVGDVAGDGPLFEIADLSQVWVEFNAFGMDAAKLAAGQTVRVGSTVGEQAAETTLDRLLPLASAASQTVVARAVLANPNGEWRPGMAVQAEVTIGSREVPLAVQRIALQRFRDFTVVFAQIGGDNYEVRMLELGQQDDEHVEVLEGLKPGTRYVTEQSFLIKADIEKSGASHDH
jgi:cobalt-zinc-cadmium efflux system membrane fusion protein